MTKHKLVCASCGSDQLVFKAHAEWNVTEQRLEMTAVGLPTCGLCGEDQKEAEEAELYKPVPAHKVDNFIQSLIRGGSTNIE